MKKSPSAMSTSLWIFGGLVAVYILGGVLFYFDLSGSFLMGNTPDPVLNFVSTIYAPVFVALGKIWPDLFPFL